MDTVPYRNEKEVTHSRQDQEPLELLKSKTIRAEVNGIFRYATPLLRWKDMPTLRSTERRLLNDPVTAEAYKTEMEKLLQAGAVQEANHQTSNQVESWYIPHHMVSHNGKNHLVFNCSHLNLGQTLNQWLWPGPTL